MRIIWLSRLLAIGLVLSLGMTEPACAQEHVLQGTIANLDRFSQPPVLALLSNGVLRTVPLPSDIPVYLSDVATGTRTKESLAAVHVGDLANLLLTSTGSVGELDESFRSRSGTIAALSNRALALADGHLVIPTRNTVVTLNGQLSVLAQLRVGDAVTVRSNPESQEIREVMASREEALPTTHSSVQITQCIISPAHALRAHEQLDVFVRGTPAGKASFSIGTSVQGVPMREVSPGLYRGIYLVAPGANFRQAAVIGHLQLGAQVAPPVTAAPAFSAATVLPEILETAPRDGQQLNNTRPSIYAVLSTPTGIAIDPNSISLYVNGQNVTAAALRTNTAVTYVPGNDLMPGSIPVVVTVADIAGNVTTYRWMFRER